MKFQNLATAIKMAEQRGATVWWGHKVNGSYFDATLVAPYSNARYLIAINCVASGELVTREEALQFSYKAERAGVNLAILVSLSGFHEDCRSLTQERGVRLLTSDVVNTTSADVLTRAFNLVLHFYGFHFHLQEKNRLLAIPEEPGVLKMFSEELKIQGPEIETNLRGLLDRVSGEVGSMATGKPQVFHIPFPKGTVAVHPNTGQKTSVTGFSLTYWLTSESDLASTEGLGSDPFLNDVSIRGELAKRNAAADPAQIETRLPHALTGGQVLLQSATPILLCL
ncbi:MAG: hypothetical protein M3410_15270 [Acidobacteriota bacterium]|nr:hypothetical protein [Acidobacteriota bacterium]